VSAPRSNVTPPEPAMSAEGAKRRQHPGFGPTPDSIRRYPEDIGHASCGEYVAVVVLRSRTGTGAAFGSGFRFRFGSRLSTARVALSSADAVAMR
jgi:hypothetical protein